MIGSVVWGFMVWFSIPRLEADAMAAEAWAPVGFCAEELAEACGLEWFSAGALEARLCAGGGGAIEWGG